MAHGQHSRLQERVLPWPFALRQCLHQHFALQNLHAGQPAWMRVVRQEPHTTGITTGKMPTHAATAGVRSTPALQEHFSILVAMAAALVVGCKVSASAEVPALLGSPGARRGLSEQF